MEGGTFKNATIGLLLIIILIVAIANFFLGNTEETIKTSEKGKKLAINISRDKYDLKVLDVWRKIGIDTIQRTEFSVNKHFIGKRDEIYFDSSESANSYYDRNVEKYKAYGSVTFKRCGSREVALVVQPQKERTAFYLDSKNNKFVIYEGWKETDELLSCPEWQEVTSLANCGE